VTEIGWWRDSIGYRRKPVRDDRLHITLVWLGDFPASPSGLIARTNDLLSVGPMPEYRIVLDSLIDGQHSSLLAPSEPLLGVMAFQSRLADRLARAHIRPPKGWRFHPHVTLAHDPRQHGVRSIDPISWKADELVLLESLIGQTRHLTRGSWSLS
jgi:2'-5' RNA ligase